MAKNAHYCRKCLLREMDEGEFFADLRTYIKNIDEDLKTGPEQYEQRLAVCRECENLFQGMCRICGCYVELRAAIKGQGCPAVGRYW